MEGKQSGRSNNANEVNKRSLGLVIAGVLVIAALIGGIWWWRLLQITISTDDAQVTASIADISPKISGRLEKLYVAEGDVVAAGQRLAELDNAPLQVAVDQAEADLEAARANNVKLPDDIKSAQAQEKAAEFSFDDARRALDQTEALYSTEAVSREALDAARSRFGAAQANLQIARARLETVNNTSADTYLAALKKAQANYDAAKLNYDNSFINAPIAGTVVRIPAVTGEILSPGTVILSISDLQSTWVVANIEETKYNRLHPGQQVDVRVDAFPGKNFAGTVTKLGGTVRSTFSLIPTQNDSGNFTKVTQRIPVKIEIPDKQGLTLKPGLSVKVTIHTL